MILNAPNCGSLTLHVGHGDDAFRESVNYPSFAPFGTDCSGTASTTAPSSR